MNLPGMCFMLSYAGHRKYACCSQLCEQQTYSWKINARRNVLLEHWLFSTKAKGPFKKRFPCMKKTFLIFATQRECSLPKCPFLLQQAVGLSSCRDQGSSWSHKLEVCWQHSWAIALTGY